MESSKAARNVKPRIIIHGGAGNIRRENLPKSSYEQYQSSLLAVLASCEKLLQTPGARALDVATHAVSMLEDNPLFNAGKGAVFTRVGMNELESSIMVSDGYRKRAVGCMLLTRTKNPIKLAREVLIRGEEDNGGGAQGHCQLSGESLERMGADWGLELVNPNYFFTQKRWQEHLRGLEKEKTPSSTNEKVVAVSGIDAGEEHDPSWDGEEYLPQGTVGAVVLDSFGTICVATSTGGLTNKLPGRIGDTPTIGAGFWAEEWESPVPSSRKMRYERQSERRTRLDSISRGNVAEVFKDCLSGPGDYTLQHEIPEEAKTIRHAVGMSGTGNGDLLPQDKRRAHGRRHVALRGGRNTTRRDPPSGWPRWRTRAVCGQEMGSKW